MTLSMSRYGDREYYAAIEELPENGEHIEDFENGDLTYYTTGRSLAIFFGNAENSNQDGLIRIGRITSDLNLFDAIGDTSEVTIALSESGDEMQKPIKRYCKNTGDGKQKDCGSMGNTPSPAVLSVENAGRIIPTDCVEKRSMRGCV